MASSATSTIRSTRRSSCSSPAAAPSRPRSTKKLKEIKAEERAPESEKTDKVLIAAAHEAGVLLHPDAARTITSHLGDDAGRVAAIVDVLASAHGPDVRLGVDEVSPYLGEGGCGSRRTC